jgi:FkbM family methyltransferase
MKDSIKYLFSMLGLAVTKKSTMDELLTRKTDFFVRADIEFALTFNEVFGDKLLDLMQKSKSQIRQDLFVISELNFKSNGYFVEFGAADGVHLSNTYLLEKEFNFDGILAEPNPSQWKDLRVHRNVKFEDKCVWSKSGDKLRFVDSGDLSTVSNFSDSDMHAEIRKAGKRFEVDTISLTDMLEKHDAPSIIDYLSIDTEGSEYEILSAHNFDRFKFKVITVEHNYTKQRESIFDLLTANGYRRKHPELSHFDDWYVLA